MVWVGVAGALLALVAGALRPSRGPEPSVWTVAAAIAFVVPVAVVGLLGLEGAGQRSKLSQGVIEAIRSETAQGDVVFSDPGTAYVLAGFAPVYINAASPGHVANTRKNRPRARARAAWRFFYSRSLTDRKRPAALRRSRADWVLVDKVRPYPREFLATLRLVFEDNRFALYRVGP
jgi:hypothetical protein